MLGFMRHEYDVFVCTTIVENGLDIPLANTIIIENAERYGLSELYQLRGRVGRSNRRAYAYLLVPADTELTEIARKRLAALQGVHRPGRGIQDRRARSGTARRRQPAGRRAARPHHRGRLRHVRPAAGGNRAGAEGRRGRRSEIHSALNLGLDIRIPPEYIADEHQRLRAYKRIADAADAAARERAEKELEDRYGPVPEAVRNLLDTPAQDAGGADGNRSGGPPPERVEY